MSYQRVVITQFGSSDVLKVIEESELPKPKPGEVRVKVLASGVAFTDIMIREGKYPGIKEKPPFSPGYDLVGVVEQLGEGVKQLQVGQRVADLMVIGAHSEYVCLPASRLILVPEALDAAEAVSLVLSYVTAYQMLHRIAKIQEGQRILIHGAGGAVGTAMIQLGNLLNLDSYGTASQAKHELVTRLGATPINYKTEDFVERIYELTGDGVDAVFDPIGGDTLKRSFSILRDNGILVSYGFYNAVMGKGGNILWDLFRLQLWNLLPNRRSTQFYSIEGLREKQPTWFAQDLTTLFDLLKQGKIKPMIAQRIALSEVKHAQELIAEAKVQGKVVVEIAPAA